MPAMHASQYGAHSAHGSQGPYGSPYGSQPTESGLHPVAMNAQHINAMPHGAPYGGNSFATASSGHGPYGAGHPVNNGSAARSSHAGARSTPNSLSS